MSGFKRKPLEADEITEALRSRTGHIPAAVAQGRGRAPKTVQVNFNASEQLAKLIAVEAGKIGSTRRLFARLLKDAGHDVPEADLNPVMNKRRWE